MLNGVGTQGLLICGFKEEGRVLGWQDCRSVVRGVEWVRSRDGDRLGADLHSRALNTEFFKSMDNGELVTFSLLLCHPLPSPPPYAHLVSTVSSCYEAPPTAPFWKPIFSFQEKEKLLLTNCNPDLSSAKVEFYREVEKFSCVTCVKTIIF